VGFAPCTGYGFRDICFLAFYLYEESQDVSLVSTEDAGPVFLMQGAIKDDAPLD
jgi:hypothetical protein